MKVNLVLLTFVAALSVTGCKSGVVDSMPKGAPKGYVTFAFDSDSQNRWNPDATIWEVKDEERQRLGRVALATIGADSYLSVALPPGEHSFVIRIRLDEYRSKGKAPEVRATAMVQEGMETPITMRVQQAGVIPAKVTGGWLQFETSPAQFTFALSAVTQESVKWSPPIDTKAYMKSMGWKEVRPNVWEKK